LTFARPGYAPVFRVVTTAAGEGTHVFDPRLTLLNLPSPIGAAGGAAVDGVARLELPAGAFASDQATSITQLSEQALPALLPYGFSPRGAVYVAMAATPSVPGTLTIPVETATGREVVVASLDFVLLQWKALAVETVAGGSLEIEIDAPGAYVVVEADADSATLLQAVIGQVLPSLPVPEGDEIEAAAVDFAPTQVLPSQRSRATVSYTLADAGTPAPSGLPLTLAVQERLTLLDGSERRAVPYSADLLVFRAPDGEPRSRFWLQPSPLAASLPIEIGAEDVSIRTFGETTVRGNILGPDGGSVLGSQGDLFEVPSGALTRPTAVTVRRRTVGDLTHAAPAGFPVLGVVEVELGGVQLAGVGRLTLATDDPPAAGSRGLLLGTEDIDGQPRWRALAELEPVAAGWRTVASGGTSPPWPGVRQGGLYLAIELEGEWGLLEGELYDSDQELAAGGLISSVAVPFVQVSNADGTYVIPLPAGAAVVVEARDARRDQVSVEIPALTDLERRIFDLEVLATGPTVVEIEPADGAANVPTSFLPRVVFSESIDRASLDEGIRMSRNGEPVAIEIDHQDEVLVIDPVASLLPDTTYQLEIGTEVADLQGRQLSSPRSVSFHTTAAPPPTPGIDATKLRLYEPDFEGNAKVVGLPGAVPNASLLWVENFETITITAESDGSFELEVPAAVGDDLFLTVLVPGQSAAVQLLEPWLLRGDLGAYIGPKGGHFKTASGLEVEVQRDSFESLTRISLEAKPAPIPTPSDLQVLLDFELDLGGQKSTKPIFVRLPAPANPPANSTFLLSRFVEALGRRGWMAMDLLRQEGGELTNAEFETAEGSLVARAAGVAATRFENPLQRVLSAENMADLRQGGYLPKASLALPGENASAAPQPAFEVMREKSAVQGLGLPGVYSGGHYQVASTVANIVWVNLSGAFEDLVVFVLSGGRTDFLAMSEHSVLGKLLVPIFNWATQVEVTVYDLTTGYQVYRQAQPPTSDSVILLPATAAEDNQLPSVVEGSPLRFVLVQTAIDGTTEVFPGIKAIVTGSELVVQGGPASTGPDTEIRLFDIDSGASTNPATAPRDKTARSNAAGEFTLTIGETRGRRFLLAIGARIGPSDRLTLRFSEVVQSIDGIELHRVGENGSVSASATAISSSPLERGIAWQLAPASGWRAGKYQLWITEQFGDNPGGQPNNTWKRKFAIELEVSRSSSVGSIALTRFADFARLGNVLAIADNDGGLRLYDVSNPATPSPFLSSDSPYRFPGGGAIRGVAIDSHGRVVAVGSGEQFRGLLHVIDPLVMDREAPAQEAWPTGVWGHTAITNPLGEFAPFQVSGLPRNVATMNNDRVNRWQAGAAAPAGQEIEFESSPIPDSDEQNLTVTGEEAGDHAPVSLRNLTRGRWNRVYADDDGEFSVSIKARAGDLLELRRGQNAWAYVSIDNRGIAMVNVDGSRGGPTSSISELALVRYTEGLDLNATGCDDSRPSVDSTPTDLDVVLAKADSDAPTASLVTLVQGYGLALYQIDTTHPANLKELSSACAAVDGRAMVAGMEVVANYPIDLDGDGRIRERAEIVPEVGLKVKEIRSYVVVAHARGHVLIFDITNPDNPRLVSRIPIGKPGQVIPVSGVTVDRANRRIYVGAFGNGLYAIDFNKLGSIGLQDADQDQLDDRVTENIQVGSEELVDALAFPDLGIIWGGGRNKAYSVAVGGPQLKAVAADGGPIREVARLAPLGTPTGHEGGQGSNPNYPAAFQFQVTVAGSVPELKVELQSLGANGKQIESLGDSVKLVQPFLMEEDALALKRQAENPWEEGSTLFLSEKVVAIADIRASIAYERDESEDLACNRCDQVAEHLYAARPTDPEDYLPEILSGFHISADWQPSLRTALTQTYGSLLTGPLKIRSVPWEPSPSAQQEPLLNASRGMGEAPPGLLLHSGELTRSETDTAIQLPGFGLAFTRTYRSQTISNGTLGPGWYHNYEAHLRELANGDLEYFDGSGRRDLVMSRTPSLFPRVRPLFGSTVRHSEGWNLTDDKGNQWQFDRFGRLLSVADPLSTGQAGTGAQVSLAYDASSRLSLVKSQDESISFIYADGKLSQIVDSVGGIWDYFYDAKGRLAEVKSPSVDLGNGNSQRLSSQYTYVAAAETELATYLAERDDLLTYRDPRGKLGLELIYERVPASSRSRVDKAKWGEGSPGADLAYDGATTTLVDRRGFAHIYQHDNFGNLTSYKDPLNATYRWAIANFEAGLRHGLVSETALPGGRKITVEYVEASSPSPNPKNLLNIAKIISEPDLTASAPAPPEACGVPPESNQDILLADFSGHNSVSNLAGVVKSALGQTTTKAFDQQGAVSSVTVDHGSGAEQLKVELSQRNALGQPRQIAVRRSASEPAVVEQRGYTSQGRLESRKVGDKEEKFEFDRAGRVIRQVAAGGVESTFEYNALGWLLGECRKAPDAADACTNYEYNENGWVTKVRSPFGQGGPQSSVRFVYGNRGEITDIYTQVMPGGAELHEHREYDPDLNPLLIDPPGEAKTEYTYNDKGQVQTVKNAAGTPLELATAYTYDAVGRVKTIDRGGRVWKIEYDLFGRQSQLQDPLGITTFLVYDASDNVTDEVVCGKDPAQQEEEEEEEEVVAKKVFSKIHRDYDASGRLDRETVYAFPFGQLAGATQLFTDFHYDGASNLTEVNDAQSRITRFTYDNLGRPVKESSGNLSDVYTEWVYDDAARKVTTRQVVGQRTVESTETYDAMGRLGSIVDGAGKTTVFHYDLRGNLVRQEAPDGRDASFQYDALDRPLRMTLKEDIEVQLSYQDGTDSHAIVYSDSQGKTTRFDFNSQGNLEKTTYPDGAIETTQYDKFGNAVTQSGPGQTYSHVYDLLDRLISRTRAAGTGEPVEQTFRWDALGHLERATAAGRTTAWTWDSTSRLLGEQQGSFRVDYERWALGLPKRVSYPSDLDVDLTFDGVQRLSSMATAGSQATFGYSGWGLTGSSIGPLTGTQTFDAAGRPELRTFTAANKKIFDEKSLYQAGGLLTGLERADTRSSWGYSYDEAGRLDEAERTGLPSSAPKRWELVSDSAYNLTEVRKVRACGVAVNRMPADGSGRHRPGQVNGEDLQWDDRGRLAVKRGLAFAYDDQDRLIEVRNSDTNALIANYSYDILNRRVERTVGGSQHLTVWDGWQAIEEYSGVQLSSRRIFGEGLDEVLRLEQNLGGSGEMTPYFPVYDAIGNVALLVRSNGEVVERYEYGPYGARLVTVNDHQGPKIEQVRLANGALQLQLSEGSVRQPTLASFSLQNLSREEQPILRLKPVNREGRQFARQLILENGDEEPEEDEEPTWPQAGDQVRFSITAGAFGDTFENASNAFVVEVEWPGVSGILSDAIPPRLEEICSQGEVLKLAFSEPVSAELAAAAFEIDGDSVIWQSENDGFVLRTMLPGGAHELTASGSPLDLAGLGLAPASSRNFTIDDQARGIYEAPFSGEAAQSAVGNVFGFQGLPEDGETGLLYVRNRYYDPEMGRFITPDPLGYVDGPNVYQFAMNSPVNFSDPLGLSMQASDYGGIAWQGFLNTKDQIFALGDLGMGGLNSGLIEGRNAYSEAREADYGIGASFMYALGRAKRQATAVQTLGFSEAQDPVAHAKALGMGLFDSLTGRDQFIKANEASEHGESWEAAGRYAAGIGAILSNVAPMMAGARAAAAEAKVARAMRAGIVSADAARMENGGGAVARAVIDCNCFVAGTPIATAQGEKPIEAIEIGDEVWAKNSDSEKVELAKVIGLFQRQAEGFLQIELSDESMRVGLLEITKEHPVFIPSRGWVTAEKLQVGDELLGLDGNPVSVRAIAWHDAEIQVYNFQVEGLHNYFAGQIEVLVHNCDFVTLYHATSAEGAANIRNVGVDLKYSREATDFGRGFYLTEDLAQAKSWAFSRHGNNGAILTFRVPRSALAELNVLDMASKPQSFLFQFFKHHRLRGKIHRFDVVSGPMLANPGAIHSGAAFAIKGHQISFHSDRAIKVLMRGLRP
jgi:RHS repeat-associated protein